MAMAKAQNWKLGDLPFISRSATEFLCDFWANDLHFL